MRSMNPVPGNPWPHDMVLRINGEEQALLDLLWVRATWGLEPAGDPPPPPEIVPEPTPTTQSLRRDKREWETAWSRLWIGVLDHLCRPHDPQQFESLWASADGSDERRRLLDEIRGPSWTDRFGNDRFDDRYHDWIRAISGDRMAEHRLPLEQHPERRCLDATIVAWERGLETIVTIPCIGEYTRTISATGLCVTRTTRADPDRYNGALLSFGR